MRTPQESGLPPPNSVSFDFRSKGEQVSTEPVRQLPSTLEADVAFDDGKYLDDHPQK